MVLSGVGNTLREERLRRQFSLEHVSNVTRIAARYLEAIENNRPSDLPGTVFTRGFVQQYARFLGLSDEALLSQLPKVDIENAALPAPPRKERRPFWTPRLGRQLRKAGWFAVTAGLGTAAWIHFDLTPVVEQSSRAAVSAAVTAFRERRLPTVAAKQAASTPSVVARSPQPEPVVDTPVTSAPVPETPADSSIRILLTAHAAAWVQVIADGKPAFTGLLHTNDTRQISGNQLVKVMTGNAGGLEISLNGKTLDPIGPLGQVRTIRLTAEGLLPDPKIPAAEPDPL